MKAYANAFLNMKENLDFTNEDILTFVWIDTLKSHNPSKTIVNVEKPQAISL